MLNPFLDCPIKSGNDRVIWPAMTGGEAHAIILPMTSARGVQRGNPLWWGYGGIPHKNISGRVGGKSHVCTKYYLVVRFRNKFGMTGACGMTESGRLIMTSERVASSDDGKSASTVQGTGIRSHLIVRNKKGSPIYRGTFGNKWPSRVGPSANYIRGFLQPLSHLKRDYG
jgi:hypothetical protein